MHHLFDNDFVIKLAQLNLLADACAIIGADPSNTRHLATLPFIARSKFRAKGSRSRGNQEILKQIEQWSQQYPDVSKPSTTEILELANRSLAIDPGEAILLEEAAGDRESVFFTGDKRCVKALGTDLHLRPIALVLQGRIRILESVMLDLMNRLGFEAVKRSVLAASRVDGMLDIAFRTEEVPGESHAHDALSSAEREIENLCPGLIRR